MKRLTLCGSLLAIVGSAIGFTMPATAIPAIYRKTTDVISLPALDDVLLIVHQFTVPAGSRVINYSVTAANSGLIEYVRCGVRANGTFLSQHAAVVGGGYASTISGVTSYDSRVPYTLDLVCFHNGGYNSIPIIDRYAEVAVY
ncbi:hypothetical protein [Nostoc sp.]|uniref:hypothetical protein n=1 Tax=Nostoc sp. TaxID=1180 RepID=UPI002FF5D63F